MAAQPPEMAAQPIDVQYITDASGHRTAVIINLERWGDLWEDFYDVMVAEARSGEPRVRWEDVRATLDVDDDVSG